MLFSAVSLLALSSFSLASPTKRSSFFAVKDALNVPPRWERVGAPSPDHRLRLHIGLKKGNFPQLEKHLYEVSDPTHPRYGQHLSQDEVDSLVRPTEETSTLVNEWLSELGIPQEDQECNQAGDWVSVTLPVAAAERLLNTEYSVYRHDDGTELIRTPEWSLPEYLHEHISTVQPTNTWMRALPKAPRNALKVDTLATVDETPAPATDLQECDPKLVTPNCLRTFYGTYNYTPKATDKQFIALNNFLEELNNRSDANIYLSKFRPDALAGAQEFKQVSIAGGTLQQERDNATQLKNQVGVEGNLDVQTMLGVAYPVPLTAYSTGGRNPTFKPDAFTTENSDEPFLVWVQYMLSLSQDQLPSVVSSSYGDDEQTIAKSYAETVCQDFAQLGARGVSLLFSSGDQGVGATGFCNTNDGKNTSTFLPSFPAGCPYVTTVGGTYQFNPEVAALDARFRIPFTSGGGFSTYFDRPDYQCDAVQAYLDNNEYFPEYHGLYNPQGRAYPDIAAQSVNYSTVWDGRTIPVDGTSASSPAAAAILGLVNDALIAAGRPVLGFLNPWLYQGGFGAFNDILSGSSAGCSTKGFPAQEGWDAVTGFGTPYFPEILKNLGLDADFNCEGSEKFKQVGGK
jgi:tripeptidyl-peptidase-1